MLDDFARQGESSGALWVLKPYLWSLSTSSSRWIICLQYIKHHPEKIYAHLYTFSVKSSEESPVKDETKEDTEFSPIKKTSKKNFKKILDDSGDEEDGNVNGNKEDKDIEMKGDQECVNGGSVETGDEDEKGSKDKDEKGCNDENEKGSKDKDEKGSNDKDEKGRNDKDDKGSNDKDEKGSKEVTKEDSPKLSCSASSDDDIPKRKTGTFDIVHVV